MADKYICDMIDRLMTKDVIAKYDLVLLVNYCIEYGAKNSKDILHCLEEYEEEI